MTLAEFIVEISWGIKEEKKKPVEKSIGSCPQLVELDVPNYF